MFIIGIYIQFVFWLSSSPPLRVFCWPPLPVSSHPSSPSCLSNMQQEWTPVVISCHMDPPKNKQNVCSLHHNCAAWWSGNLVRKLNPERKLLSHFVVMPSNSQSHYFNQITTKFIYFHHLAMMWLSTETWSLSVYTDLSPGLHLFRPHRHFSSHISSPLTSHGWTCTCHL